MDENRVGDIARVIVLAIGAGLIMLDDPLFMVIGFGLIALVVFCDD